MSKETVDSATDQNWERLLFYKDVQSPEGTSAWRGSFRELVAGGPALQGWEGWDPERSLLQEQGTG